MIIPVLHSFRNTMTPPRNSHSHWESQFNQYCDPCTYRRKDELYVNLKRLEQLRSARSREYEDFAPLMTHNNCSETLKQMDVPQKQI